MRRLVFVVTDIRLEIRKRYNYIMKCENEIPWEMCGILGVTYRTLYPFLFMMLHDYRQNSTPLSPLASIN